MHTLEKLVLMKPLFLILETEVGGSGEINHHETESPLLEERPKLHQIQRDTEMNGFAQKYEFTLRESCWNSSLHASVLCTYKSISYCGQ